MNKKYLLDIKDIRTKENINKEINTFLEEQNSIFNIVWLKKEYISMFNGKYFFNMRDVKRQYPGQSYLFYPFHKEKNGLCLIDNNKDHLNASVDGYVVVSKRAFRTEYSFLKYDKISVLKTEIDKKTEEFINEINSFQSEYLFKCTLRDTESMTEIDSFIIHHTNNEELIIKYVVDNTKILDVRQDNIACINLTT